MSFQSTPARSSRITKSRRPTAAAALGLRPERRRRKTPASSPSANLSKRSLPSDHTISHDHDKQLQDTGLASLAHDPNFCDVPQFIRYIRNSMFSDMPENSGIGSTRKAEILNYRSRLPPFVTIAHVDALTTSSTIIEREIARLAQGGIVRRVSIPHRGVGAAAVGDGVALVQEWHQLIRSNDSLTEDLKAKYLSAMNANPALRTISCTSFTTADIHALVDAGFLTSINVVNTCPSSFTSLSTSMSADISASGARHPAGSLDAVGGASAKQHIHGGTSLASSRTIAASTFSFSLPNAGTHIKLLVEARKHLLAILNKTKYKEMPLCALRERWNGGVSTRTNQRERKGSRGEFTCILPGRTKKWNQFYGMRFEWILEQCVGAGLLELFETGSVGRAARLTS